MTSKYQAIYDLTGKPADFGDSLPSDRKNLRALKFYMSSSAEAEATCRRITAAKLPGVIKTFWRPGDEFALHIDLSYVVVHVDLRKL